MGAKINTIQDIIEKTEEITTVDKLISYNSARELFSYIHDRHERNAMGGNSSWLEFCEENGIHNVYTKEYVDSLIRIIKNLNKEPVLEVCAGNGKLTYHLNQAGVHIIATDDYSDFIHDRNNNLVERLSHQEALKKYNPEVIIGAWIPLQSRIGFDILDYPTVKYFIDIGDKDSGQTWITQEAKVRKDYRQTLLIDLQRYSMCKNDFPGSNISEARLFSRIF